MNCERSLFYKHTIAKYFFIKIINIPNENYFFSYEYVLKIKILSYPQYYLCFPDICVCTYLV